VHPVHDHAVGYFQVAHWTRALVSALGGVVYDRAIHPEKKVKVRTGRTAQHEKAGPEIAKRHFDINIL